MCSPQEAGASSNASTAANRGASEKNQPSRSPVSPSGTRATSSRSAAPTAVKTASGDSRFRLPTSSERAIVRPPGQSCRHHAIALRAEAGDGPLHHVAGTQPAVVVAAVAGGRAREDDVTGQQLRLTRRERDE